MSFFSPFFICNPVYKSLLSDQNLEKVDGFKGSLAEKLKSLLSTSSPRSITNNRQLDIHQIHELLTKNDAYPTQSVDVKVSRDDFKSIKWPCSLKIEEKSSGICYYNSDLSELTELLGLCLVDHFVPSETSSSFVLHQLPSKDAEISKTAIASPRRRLSHLAKRRAVFSSIKLQSLQSNSLRTGRQIFVAKSRNDGTSNNKSCSYKAIEKRESHKRRLFSEASSCSLAPNKRQRVDAEENVTKEQKPNELSSSHKQKLLWAVVTALQSKNILSSNSRYKDFARQLSMIVKYTFQNSTEANAERTSVVLKEAAKRHVSFVISGGTFDDLMKSELRSISIMSTKENQLIEKTPMKKTRSYESPTEKRDILREHVNFQNVLLPKKPNENL